MGGLIITEGFTMKKIVAILLASVLAFGCVGCSIGVSQDEYNQVVSERDALRDQVKSLQQLVNLTGDIQDSSSNNDEDKAEIEYKDLEIKESGWSVRSGYLYYGIVIHNPNENYAIEHPTYRITARDESGNLLGTENQGLSIIYPGKDFVHGGLGFEVSKNPSEVTFEIMPPDDYDISDTSTMEHPQYDDLVAQNVSFDGDTLLCEIFNPNDYDVDTSTVTVIFRDESGKIVGGDYSFSGTIPANESIPFSEKIYDPISDNLEVYVNQW